MSLSAWDVARIEGQGCDGGPCCPCLRCDEPTLCVEVRFGEPQHVEEGRTVGEVLYLEQCDGCGCSCFAVEPGGVRCIGEDDDETEQRAEGCGRLIPFQRRPAREVIW